MPNRTLRVLWIITVLVLALSTTGLAARHKVQFWWWGGGQETLEQLIADFETANPSIEIELVVLPYDATFAKWAVAIAAGTPPDASLANTLMLAPLSDGLEPLDGWVARSSILKKGNYFPAHWEAGVHEGKLLLLPFRANSQLIFYDKQAFAQAGIAGVPRTWSELSQTATRLTIRSGDDLKRWGFSFRNTKYHNRTVDHFANRNGWQRFDAAYTRSQYLDGEIVQSLEFLNDMVARGVSAIRSMSGVGNLAGGLVAMVNTGPWELPTIMERNPSLDIGAFQVPKGPSGKPPYALLQGEHLTMFKGSKNKEAAIKFLEYLSYTRSGDFARLSGGYFPVTRSAVRDSYWFDSEVWQAVLQNYEEGLAPLGPNPCGVRFASDDQYERVLDDVLRQRKAVMTGLQEVHALAENDLKQVDLLRCLKRTAN